MVPDAAVTNWSITNNCIAFFAKLGTADAVTGRSLSSCVNICQADSSVPAYDQAVCSESSSLQCLSMKQRKICSVPLHETTGLLLNSFGSDARGWWHAPCVWPEFQPSRLYGAPLRQCPVVTTQGTAQGSVGLPLRALNDSCCTVVSIIHAPSQTFPNPYGEPERRQLYGGHNSQSMFCCFQSKSVFL